MPGIEDTLQKAAEELVKVVDKALDANAPREIAEIIKTHALGAAAAGVASGWIPGAGGTIASLAAAGFVWTMYGRINSKIGLPMSENVLKSLATGVATNLAAYVVGGVVFSTIFSFVPGIGSAAASIIIGSISFALTVASGFVYLKILTEFFASGKNPATMSEEQMKSAADRIISENKGEIQDVLEAAKSDYKSSKK